MGTPDKEQNRSHQKAWAARNPDKVRAKRAMRRARMKLRVPKWFGELDDFIWKEAADLARRRELTTGIRWHCDHIIPLAGEIVSGLHVWNNCAVIPAVVNHQKNNRY